MIIKNYSIHLVKENRCFLILFYFQLFYFPIVDIVYLFMNEKKSKF